MDVGQVQGPVDTGHHTLKINFKVVSVRQREGPASCRGWVSGPDSRGINQRLQARRIEQEQLNQKHGH